MATSGTWPSTPIGDKSELIPPATAANRLFLAVASSGAVPLTFAPFRDAFTNTALTVVKCFALDDHAARTVGTRCPSASGHSRTTIAAR
jgi:hypothetical protein